MKQTNALTQENFKTLLNWFSPDKDEAGERYEQIRQGLIRYFQFRGCQTPDLLADETITRVAVKLPSFDMSNNVKTVTYFYGFAKNIYLEYRKKNKEIGIETVAFLSDKTPNEAEKREEIVFDCLDNCLARFPSEERDLLLQYYSKNKQEKFELRRNLAAQWNLKKGTLHTKIHRLKSNLGQCVRKCLAEKSL